MKVLDVEYEFETSDSEHYNTASETVSKARVEGAVTSNGGVVTKGENQDDVLDDLFCVCENQPSLLIMNENPVAIAFSANCVLRVDDVDMT